MPQNETYFYTQLYSFYIRIYSFFSDNDQLLTNGNAAKDASSKLSKIGRRIRDSCRQHLRGKHLSGGASSAPEDYGSIPAPNVSIKDKSPVVPFHEITSQ